MAAEAITLDELIAAIREAGGVVAESDDGMTLRELAASWNVSTSRTLRVLRQAKDAGRLKIGRRLIENLAGDRCSVPCYAFLAKKARRR